MKHAWLKTQRWLSRRRELTSPFDSFLDEQIPSPADDLSAIEFVSLDIETTSLDAANADMLSVGWVVMRDGRVDLGSAETCIVRPTSPLGRTNQVSALARSTRSLRTNTQPTLSMSALAASRLVVSMSRLTNSIAGIVSDGDGIPFSSRRSKGGTSARRRDHHRCVLSHACFMRGESGSAAPTGSRALARTRI